jgi:hypothetical protein
VTDPATIPLTHQALLWCYAQPAPSQSCDGDLRDLGKSWLYRGPALRPARTHHYQCRKCARFLEARVLTGGFAVDSFRPDQATILKPRRAR